MPVESLVPGYRLVGSFGPDSEYETRPSVNPEGNGDGEEEVEEEVEYVTLEISGIADVDPSLLTSYRLIGLGTPTPFLQLSSSGTIFKGRHHKLLGTELLFTHSPDDPDPPGRNISLLGTTEKRIVFSPVEIRNPSSSTPGTTSKGEEPISSSKKGKKKANFWANGVEDVVGGLGAGVSKPSALDEQDGDPGTRSKAAGKKKDDSATQDDENGDTFATEEENIGEEAGGDGTFETDPPPRNDEDESGNLSIPTTTTPPVSTTPVTVTGLNTAQLHGAPSDTLMAIDPALGALRVPSKQPPSQAPGSGTDI